MFCCVVLPFEIGKLVLATHKIFLWLTLILNHERSLTRKMLFSRKGTDIGIHDVGHWSSEGQTLGSHWGRPKVSWTKGRFEKSRWRWGQRDYGILGESLSLRMVLEQRSNTRKYHGGSHYTCF